MKKVIWILSFTAALGASNAATLAECVANEERPNYEKAAKWWNASSATIDAFKKNQGGPLVDLSSWPLIRGPSRRELLTTPLNELFPASVIQSIVNAEPICGDFNSEGGFIASGNVWFAEIVGGGIRIASMPGVKANRSNPQYPSFDCDAAKTYAEKAICSDRALMKMDSAMARYYRELLADKKGVKQLKQSQRQWLKERNKCKDFNCVYDAVDKRLTELFNTSEEKNKRQHNK